MKDSGPSVVLQISPCSSMMLASSGNRFYLWDVASGLLKSTLRFAVFNKHSCCRFFPDGKTIVSASYDNTLKLWDVASGSLVRTLVGHTKGVQCIDVSPDSARILSVSSGNTWKLWNSRMGDFQHTEHVNPPSLPLSPALLLSPSLY